MKKPFKLIFILSLISLAQFWNANILASDGEAESSNIGPDKGILKADEHLGFQLSEKALQNFAVETLNMGAGKELKIPRTAIVLTGEEKNIFRLRGDFFKRVDFITINESIDFVLIRSPELREGDRIVIKGVGFLRIAEIAAFGGAETSHSH